MDEKKKKELLAQIEADGLLSGFVDGELDEVQCQKICSVVSV